MRQARKRFYRQVSGFGRTDSERRRPRRKVDDLPRDSREISPKRRRITDERGGEAWTGRTNETPEDPQPLRYKALEEICNSLSIEAGILDLANKAKRFEALLKSKTDIRPDLMKLVIHAIYLCCSPSHVRENAERLLRVVINSNFLRLHLSSFISQMSYNSELDGNFLPFDLISRLAEMFLELLQRFGREIVDSIPLAQLSEALRELKDRRLLHEDTDVLEKKILQVREYRDELIRRKIQSARGQEDESHLAPPEDFREISVIPEAKDLKIDNKPFLRVNVVDGSYEDQKHYLDVQFRLLREDFILPLREGIRQLQKDYRGLGTAGSSHSNRAQDVQVYRDVTVLYPVCSGKGMVYRIRFDVLHYSLRRVKWDKCKLLKFGSLLCLSADNFYTPLFATVENRDPRELCLGELEVRFESVQLETVNRFVEEKKKFDMVESPAFFESYRHVLEGLQEIQPGELPFHEHIVKCSRDVGVPDYEDKTNGFFDMRGITEDEAEGTAAPQRKSIVDELMLEDDSVIPSDPCSIDSNDLDSHGDLAEERPEGFVNIYDLQLGQESLGFNESQMRAFKMALTKRFAVVQGPPGTGKTYVGLKIALVLLKSSMLWQNGEQHSPILMVSYTNHALDEFLGGLPSEGMGIVRVGGRCSDKLKCCSLKVRRDEAVVNKQTPRRISTALKNTRTELRDLEKDGSLERCIAVLKFSRRRILSFHILKQFMSKCHVKWFERKQMQGLNALLCHWLGVQFVASRDSKKERDRDVHGNEDFQMQVSVRNFSNEQDFEDDDGENAVKPSEVTICTAEDTNNPAGLRRNLQQEFVTSEDGVKRYHDLNQLSVNQRWKLYRLWVQKTENHYLKQLQKKQPDYERALARKFELMLEEDFHVLRNARVIGMTTTCAARYRRILQRIRPKIILVEEAAEVLEAHIITSLTKGCQHLILIGDHQQLRPKPAVYELAKKFKLDVSLFERMVKAGIQCERLSVQHRMRPEIAALMKHIYDDLENHESVEKYENIKGMKKNMFFIDHRQLEYSSDGTHSHVNEHEAMFLVALCRYLLQQGYSSDQITLLTTYTGQMFAIRDLLQAAKGEELEHVRLTTVDNFQGEENDIILLSLVRSNKDEKVGFISDVNRACVALSRAKKGLYCIGNFALLSKHSEIWGKIVSDLNKSGSTGNALPFVCQIHPNDVMMAETAEDFRRKAPDGGCQRPCEVRLECGHACKRLCHPTDTDHLEYRCGEPCAKKMKRCDHDCPKLCYQTCGTDCSEFVEKTLSSCGHKQTVRCGTDSSRVRCKERCNKILPTCSHRCQSRCGEPCTKQCQELKKRTDLLCGHEVTMACSATQADCPISCEATLECGHLCSGKCGECRMGRVHKRCSLKCDRVLVCSHLCKEPCPMSCPPCSLPCENRCVHSKCEHQCGEECVPCRHKCAWKCFHYKCDKRCGEMCNRPRCDEPCNKILKCGNRRNPHPCRGLCGEDCICAVCEKNGGDAITEIFLGGEDEEDALFIQLPDCKHIFAVSDLDRYMDTTNDDSDGRHLIQLKSCPRCKTAIRRSLRYGNVIKQQLHDIEQVKRRVRGDSDELIKTQEKLQTRLIALKGTFNGEDEMKEWEMLERRLRRKSKRSKTSAVVTENQVTLMERFCAMKQKLKANLFSAPRCEVSTEIRLEGIFLQGEMEYLKKRFMSERVTHREFRDINLEFTRLNVQLELCLLEYDVTSLKLTMDESSRLAMRNVREELSSGKLMETEKLDEMLKRLAAIRGSYPCLSPLTSEERKQIVSAIGLSQGHWFRCLRGHIYAIGECGGPMQRSTCPECGAVIGGANHRLEEGNALAPEMDGASHPAWSEQANLENYIIVEEA